MTPVFGRILRVTVGQPLTVPLFVPAAWAKEFIVVELTDANGTALASTLSGRGAFAPPNLATRTFMARDVQLHLAGRHGQQIKIVARCPLGAVSEATTVAVD